MKNNIFRTFASGLATVIFIAVAAGALPYSSSPSESALYATNQTPDRSGRSTIHGQPGTAALRAVVEMAEIARREQIYIGTKATPDEVIFNFQPDRDSAGDYTLTQESPPPVTSRLLDTSPPPAASFLALEDDNTRIPPDTHGSVGPNHLMVTLNSQVRIQNKSGAALSTVSLNSFWAGVNGGSGAFDPRVLYDPYSNRWIVVSADDVQSIAAGLLIAVSQTSDPTGAWNQYRIPSADTNWIDYPNIGFNKNWIVVTANIYSTTNAFVRKEIYAFDKTNLYIGGAGNYTLFADTSGGGSWSPAETFDNSLTALYLLQAYSSTSGTLRMAIISGPIGSESFSTDTSGSYNVSYGSGWVSSAPNGDDFAPQLGSSMKIQTNDHRVQNVVYRNGRLWTTHTIFLPAGGTPTHSAIQWWQIAPNNPPTAPPGALQRGRIDDESAQIFYAFPSIAVNKADDALIGYSRFSAVQYASGNYSVRAASDPLNTLRSDVVLKSGEAPYYKIFTGSRNRWGDYSHSSIDPVNDVDFWTIQQYAWTNDGSRDRWSTWWGKVLPPGPPGTPTPTATPTVTPTSTSTPTLTSTPTITPTPTSFVFVNPIYLPIVNRN